MTESFGATMSTSRQKFLFLSLVLCGCISVTDSFGQHSHRTSIIHHRSTGQLNSHDQLRSETSKQNSPRFPKKANTKIKGRPRQNWKYQNEFGILNKKITEQENAQDVLGVLASTKGALSSIAGGGKMSTVNFSTSIHRIARHVTQYTSKNKPGNDRAVILKDPRFALLMCSAAEALLDGAEKADFQYKSSIQGAKSEDGRNFFGARELANVAWAIAKMNIAPPESVVKVDISNAESLLREKSKSVRSAIFEVAKQRATSGSSSPSSSSTWIPALSELCGLIVDTVSSKSLKLDPTKFQQQELSNLMWALATTQRPNQEVFEFVISSIIASAERRKKPQKNKGKQKDLTPQEWSIPLWVLAKTGTDLGHEEQLLPFVNDMMENEPGFLERFKPQELSNSVWAAATIISKRQQKPRGAASEAALGILRHTSKQLTERGGEGYKTQEVANHAWAMATLGFGITANQAAIVAESCQLTHSYTYLISDDPEGDEMIMKAALKTILQKAKQNIRYFSSQEMNNLCWAMARLDHKDEELLRMIGMELANPKKSVGSQDLSTTLWSMARMEFFDEDLYRAVVARFHDIGTKNFKPQEISNTLWALSTAGVTPKYLSVFDDVLLPDSVRPSMEEAMRDPVTAMFGAGAAEFSRRPDDFKTQEVKDLIWSFARAGMRHPRLFKAVAEHLVGKGDDAKMTGRGMSGFNTQGIANMAYSYARHAQLGGETMDKYKQSCRLPFTGGKLACYTIVFLDIGEGLLRKLFVEIARADLDVHDNLSKCTTQDISNTCWAMGVVGLKHQTFLEAAEKELRSRMVAYVNGSRNSKYMILGQEMGNVLWAFATLDYTPSGILELVEQYWVAMFDGDLTVSNLSKYMSRQEMANIAWATAVFGEYPRKLIELLHNGILGVSEGLDPQYMQNTLYKDEGILPTHFNSLLYLQIMMDLDLGVDNNSYYLPENFPSGWTSNPALMAPSNDPEKASSTDTNGIMELSTSAIQTRVSKAFDRIDFGHVDEYLLTMKDLVDEFDIQMPPLTTDILSLDIANIDARIGVEVDGPGHWISNIDPSLNPDILESVGSYRKWSSKNGDHSFEYTFNWNANDQAINGSTSLKWRLFNKIGWKIISVPFWDWIPIDNVRKQADEAELFEAQDNFCRALLESE